jgi:hypothetical protein
MKDRLAPFLVLLEARYAPLLFAVAPQAYAVYLWLFPQPYDVWGELFAVMGAIGYEFVYVGAIAWAEEDRSSVWTWATATVALIFSVVVAYYVYRYQGAWAWLHAGFPLVAFTYTLNMYSKRSPSVDLSTAKPALEALPERSRSEERANVGTYPANVESARVADETPAFDLPYAVETDSLAAQLSGIYAIENTANGRIYIGSTICFEKRRRQHLLRLIRGRHSAFHMQQDWDACIDPAFVFRILESHNGDEQLHEREQRWINELAEQRGADTLYNTDVADLLIRDKQLLVGADRLPIAERPAQVSIVYEYECPHCNRPLKNKQAVGAARTNGYCLGCKAERLAEAVK